MVTELLGSFGAIRRTPLFVCCILAAAMIFVLRRPAPNFVKPRFDFLVATCSAG